MVASGDETLRQVAKDRLAVVQDLAGFAVHQLRRADHSTTECVADGLVTKTDAENRKLSSEAANHVDTNASLLGRARAGGYDNARGRHFGDLVKRDLVVAADFQRFAQLAEELGQVVGEGIVVVDEQDHGSNPFAWLFRFRALGLFSARLLARFARAARFRGAAVPRRDASRLESREHRTLLIDGFLIFGRGNGIGDESRARLQMNYTFFDDHGA